MATPEERDAAVALHRQNINLRSVTRNDPAAVEILETSAYSTIYHYEDPEWEKQKMEGPTFIIRRDKQPHYAIYMLNRQTVKNVSIPLVPGEIKVTVVKEDMLQIARRGEKVKRAMWFSEGGDGVSRFRAKILQICGEPSKVPPVAGGVVLPLSPSPAPGTAGPGANDGFSRLFANLMPSASQSQESVSLPRTGTPTPAPPRTAVGETPTTQSHSPGLSLPIAPERSNEPNFAPAIAAPPTLDPTPSTGQTADDLLMSILGMAPLAISPSAPPPRAQSSTPQQPSAPPASIVPYPPMGVPSPPPPMGSQISPFPPLHLPAPPPHPPQSGHPPREEFPPLSKAPPHGPSSASPSPYSQAAQPRSPPHHRQEPPLPNGHLPPDAMSSAVARVMAPSHLDGAIRDTTEDKGAFVNTLLRRIHTEPGFVDALWDEYLRLSSRGHHPAA